MSQSEPYQSTARIHVQKGPQPNQIFDLFLDQLTIGRSATNEITITDPEISRKHAKLVRQGTDYAIEDLGSTNGTFVNDRRIVGLTPLHDGDIIEFGEAVQLAYEAESTLPIEIDIPPMPSSQPEPVASVPDSVPPLAPPPVAQSVSIAPQSSPPPSPNPIAEEQTSSLSCRRMALLGCGTFVLLIFLCAATLLFLDAYDQGRLLYCGPLQSFWELILGLLGFASPCL